MSRRSAAQDVATAALMAAAIEVCKLFMQSLPNIEMTSFLVILFTLRMGRPALYAIPVFVLIEGLVYGFGLWWIMYLYTWPLLAVLAWIFRKQDNVWFWSILALGILTVYFSFM